MNAMKKSATLLAAVSAFALSAGSAMAGNHGGYNPPPPPVPQNTTPQVSDCCGVSWEFNDADIGIHITPDDLNLAALSSVCANQDFVGVLDADALAVSVTSGNLANGASAVANVISVTGDNGKSPFAGIVETVQKANGVFTADAVVTNATVINNGTFANTATAAANVVNIDTSTLALLDAEQIAGAANLPMSLRSTAIVTGTSMQGGAGSFDNTASSVANVASLNVSPAAGAYPHTSLALVDVNQTAFVNMTALASATGINTAGGSFNNAATAAANVVSVINK